MIETFAISEQPSFGESINFLIPGFTIVLLTLFVLSIVTSLVGKLFSMISEKAKPVRQSAPVTPPAFAIEDSQLLAPSNFLLMHAMGPNVAGVIGTAMVAGLFIATLEG